LGSAGIVWKISFAGALKSLPLEFDPQPCGSFAVARETAASSFLGELTA
jgi:hypothetical protein